jgi:hypothetical protein
VGAFLNRRRLETAERTEKLRQELIEAEHTCSDAACVYATGSFGRGEASLHSDLDIFIVGKGTKAKPALSGLDEILIKADLIEATRKQNFPDFSGDGEYLKHHTVAELAERLGTPEDDVVNTFTARLLLLLESSPLLGIPVYQDITKAVIAAYWGDYEDHKTRFMPAFLANDILRMWRTFCVNYEARTQKEPEEKKAKRKIKNYKLKHSRLLTCYSALLYLLAIYSKNGTVSPGNTIHMISLTPTARLEWLLEQTELADARTTIEQLLKVYEDFLAFTDASESELIERFLDKAKSAQYRDTANQFGDLVFKALNAIGKGSPFHRLIVV